MVVYSIIMPKSEWTANGDRVKGINEQSLDL